jgi:predicted nuclease with TOPRIM domain
MCGRNKTGMFLVFLSLCCSLAVLQAGDQWYLITDQELRSIEEYRKNSEAEKLSWLSQVQTLRARAGNLEAESASLNSQLRNQREQNQKLTRLFNEYEQDQSLLMSRKDTRIVELETENEGRSKLITRLIIAVVLLGTGLIASVVLRLR